MLHSASTKLRLAVSAVSNVIRAFTGFITGMVIARSLNPAGYGDLMFLLGSFAAIRSLLDLGSSSAFYTFLSQRPRSHRFYFIYFGWLAFQFVLTLLLLSVLMPASLLEKIWLQHNREIVVLAFMASFMQQQVWLTISQIGEAMRKTVKVQVLNLSVGLIYLAAISAMSASGFLSIKAILLMLLGQYFVASILAYQFLKDRHIQLIDQPTSFLEIFDEYKNYCKPLIALAFVSFIYDFADKWMLQRFGGAAQQGYFQIASQFAAISLLATTSILNVFWKEVADATAKRDQARVEMMYRKINRGLVMFGAVITGLLLPWSKQIVMVCLGPAYVQAWPVFALMLLYPIHQSMGQIGGAMFLAGGHTYKYMMVSIAIMLVSVPVTYIVLAPTSTEAGIVMGLGAFGLACKMVVLGIISVNIQAFVIARQNGWKFDWTFQAVGIPLMIVLGFISKMFSGIFWDIEGASVTGLICPVIAAGFCYLLCVLAVIWRLSWLVGMERIEIKRLFIFTLSWKI